MAKENIIETDVLIIGGGMSGLFAAMKARKEGVDVTLAEKGYFGRSGEVFMAEGFYCVFNPEWGHNLKEWMTQIAKAGDYMTNPAWTEVCLQNQRDRYADLNSWGVKFIEGEDGKPLKWVRGAIEIGVLGMGWTYFPPLRAVVVKSGVKIMDRTMITDLVKQDGRVVGAIGFNTRTGDFYIFKAKATVICTSGGVGEAMAYRAGCEITNKEFVMGTGSYSYAGPEYYGDRGDGEKINLKGKKINPPVTGGWTAIASHYIDRYVDAEGRKVNRYTMGTAIHEGRAPILWNIDAAEEKEIKDVLREIEQGGLGFKQERVDWDVAKRGLFSQPGMGMGGYGMGGLHGFHGGGSGIRSIDTKCTTQVPGLYAAGDAYNSGSVAAKYPFWGFGLSNATVTGAIAGKSAAEYAFHAEEVKIDKEEIAKLKNSIYDPLERKGGFDRNWVNAQIRNITGAYYVGIVRHGDRLKAALPLIEFLKNHIAPKMYAEPRDAHGLVHVLEAKSAILSAEMALRAALFRTESRGSHYREDYPRRDDPKWLAQVVIKEQDGEMKLTRRPIPKKYWPDLSKPYRERYPMEFPGEE